LIKEIEETGLELSEFFNISIAAVNDIKNEIGLE
jgi:predicted hydrolase (HD superfamily)